MSAGIHSQRLTEGVCSQGERADWGPPVCLASKANNTKQGRLSRSRAQQRLS